MGINGLKDKKNWKFLKIFPVSKKILHNFSTIILEELSIDLMHVENLKFYINLYILVRFI